MSVKIEDKKSRGLPNQGKKGLLPAEQEGEAPLQNVQHPTEALKPEGDCGQQQGPTG